MAQWTPILQAQSPLRDRAFAAVEGITRTILANGPAPSQPSLNLAAALLLTYRWLGDGDSQWITPAIAHLNAAISSADYLYSTRRLGLSEGLAGLGWVVEHLSRRISGEPKESHLNADVDAALIQELQSGKWQHGWDLEHGLLGLAVYFLERLPAPAAREGLSLIGGHLEEVFRVRRMELEDPRGVAELVYFLGAIEQSSANLSERASKFLGNEVLPVRELEIAAIALQTSGGDIHFTEQRIERALTTQPNATKAHFWNVISHLHPDPRCCQAAIRATKELLDLWEREGAAPQETGPAILTGAAGTGLVLLAAVNAVDPEWGRLLCLWPARFNCR